MKDPTDVSTEDLVHRIYLALKTMPCSCVRNYDMKVVKQCRRCMLVREYESQKETVA